MNAVPFDTLKMARELEAAGFSGTQAAGAAEAMAEVMVRAELATKTDVTSLGDRMKTEMELIRRDLELLRRDMTIRLGGMMIVGIGVMLTAMRYMLMHS